MEGKKGIAELNIDFNPDEEQKKNSMLDNSIILEINDDDLKDFKCEEEDLEIFENILNGDIKKKIKKENDKMNKIEKSFKKANISFVKQSKNKKAIVSSKLKFKEESLSKKLVKFFLSVYQIISKENYDKDEENDENIKEKNHLLNIINEILLEYENNNCKFSFIYSENNNTLNDNSLTLNLKVIHEIVKFNGLVNIKIIFKVELKMFISSGDTQINIARYLINYENYNDKNNSEDIKFSKHNDKEIIMKPNFKCFLINNILGNYGITYCTCGDCMKCMNRKEPKPFDKLLNYLKKKNEIESQIPFTRLWFGKYNKYRNESNYKCSFCKEFYEKKLNIVKLFCNPDFDPDHSCIFWICKDCYFNKKKNNMDNMEELCPNCGKFYINFTQLYRIFRYYKWRKHQ